MFSGNGPALGAGINTQNVLASGGGGFIGYSLRRTDDTNGGWLIGGGVSTAGDFSIIQNQGAGTPIPRFLISNSGNVIIGAASGAASAILDLISTTGAFLPPRMTTAQRDALTAVDGMILYNSTTAALNYRKAGAWVAI